MPRPCVFIPALLTLACAAPAPATVPSAPAATTTSRPASQPADPHWQNLLQRLGDNAFSIREAAQKELDKTTLHDLATLRPLTDAAADPEVKARLTARLAAIEEDVLINPPGLTVELKDASLQEVADKLSAAMGMKFEAYPPNGRAPGQYTLSASEKPFWQIISELSRQQSFTVQDSGSQLRLYAQSGSLWRHVAISGPVVVVPQSITRERNANLQADDGKELGPESLSLSCQVCVDPRLRVLKYSSLVFTTIVDENGNSLLSATNGSPPMWESSGRSFVNQSFGTALVVQDKKGTRIASARGYLPLTLQTGEERVEVAEVDKKEGESFELGGNTIKITKMTTQVGSTNMNLTLSRPPAAAGPAVAPLPVIYVSLIDFTGKTMLTTTLRGSMGAGVGGTYTPPFKLRLSMATKTKDVSYPFELKDLPLP